MFYSIKIHTVVIIVLLFRGYDPSVCRSIGASFRGRTKYNGIPVAYYDLDLNEEMNVKKCFCRDEDSCPPKGTFDLFRCSGV